MARRENDNYPTDPLLARWVVKHAVNIAGFDPPEICNSELRSTQDLDMLEPCCGDTAPFAAAAHSLGMRAHGFDIRDIEAPAWADPSRFRPGVSYQKEFENLLSKETGIPLVPSRYPKVIATNPPFSDGLQIAKYCVDVLDPWGVCAFIVKVAFIGTQARSAWFMKNPPSEVWIISKRPSFTGDGKTDMAQEYCVVFWLGSALYESMKRLNGGHYFTRLHWLNNKGLMTPKQPKRVVIEKEKSDGTETAPQNC